MTLLIDSGNTRIKLGWRHPLSGARETAPIGLHADQLDQLANWLQAGHAPLDAIRRHDGRRALGVNVAGPLVQAQIDAAVQALGLGPVLWLRSEPWAFGLHNGYEQPAQLGADRWMALLGLCDRLQEHAAPEQPALLASFGTATTVDLLSPRHDGARSFPGGCILPGPSLMLDSLKQNTAQLPQAQGEVAAFPTNTIAAISTGVAAAQAGAVLRQWEQGRRRYLAPPLVFIAGGARAAILHELRDQLRDHCQALGLAAPPIHELDTPALSGLALYARVGQK